MTRDAQLVHSVDVRRYVVCVRAIPGGVSESVGRVASGTLPGRTPGSGLTRRVTIVALKIGAACRGVPIVPEEIYFAIHARVTFPAIA